MEICLLLMQGTGATGDFERLIAETTDKLGWICFSRGRQRLRQHGKSTNPVIERKRRNTSRRFYRLTSASVVSAELSKGVSTTLSLTFGCVGRHIGITTHNER